MLKKLLAGLTAIALSLGMVALTAGPASAHHNTINALVSCNTGTEGTWKVTWTIANSEGISEKITSSSDTSLVPVDTEIAGGATLTVVRYYSSKPASNVTLTLSAKWTNNNTNTSSGTLYKNDFSDNCLPDDTSKEVPVCHYDSGQGGKYTSNTVSVNSVLNGTGHGGHSSDIIPPFDYVKQGVAGHYNGKNWNTAGQNVYNNGCSYVKPTAPTFTAATCVGPNSPGQVGQASYTIPTTTGARYWVSINDGAYSVKSAGTYYVNVGTKVEVYAEELPGYELDGFDSQWEWSTTFASPTPDCEPDVTPTKPTIVQAVCTGEQQVGQASYTIPSITGIKYQTSNGQNGPWTDVTAGVKYANDGTSIWVQAVALPGYDVVGTSKWKLEFDNVDSSKCDVPAAPTFTAQACTGPGTSNTASYTIPSDNGIKYQVRINGGSWQNVSAGTVNVTVFPRSIEVQALPNGNIIVPGSAVYWSFNFVAAGACLVDAPSVAPSWADAYCYAQTTGTSPAGFTVNGTPGDHVSYWISTTGQNGTYSPIADGPHSGTIGQTVWIKAVPDAGYQLKDYTGPWSHTFSDPGDCLDEVTPGPVTPTYPVCSPNTPGVVGQGGYTLPDTIPTGVKYTVTINSAPSFTGTPGFHPLSVGDTVTITATALDGYKLAVGSWTWGPWEITAPTDPNARCYYPAPVDPIVKTDQTCVVDDLDTGEFHNVKGEIKIPSTPHVKYFIDGVYAPTGTYPYDPGTYEISAEADSGYYLTGVPEDWKVVIEKAKPCGLPTYPVVVPEVKFVQTTCSTSGTYTLIVEPSEEAAGVIWTVSGGLPNTVGTHAVNAAGTVTIKAVPAPLYGFGDGLPGTEREWSFDFTSLPDDCLPTLALTGSSIATGGLGLAGLLTLGGILMITANRRRAALIGE